MSEMISVASGFQYSVNIGYDLNSEEKLQNFIPTKSALRLLDEILQSTNDFSTDRARVLIGAYGKGKSHIILTILSMLMKKDLSLFKKLMPCIEENPGLKQRVRNLYESDNRILPVIITGSNASLTQAFLLALQRTLSDNNLLDIMPESNYKAAVSVINRWKTGFPDTYKQLKKVIDTPIAEFVENLESYNILAYEQFERIYPELTAGSVFNPFLGFDVVELYEKAAFALKRKGYSGIFVVYDEFSKFLEANITEASVRDVKMLQDFAEKCNRSGEAQMHLLMISHKEISNYIDKLPQQKVDGWRGVSERFTHIHLNNNFSQTYEIISSVIQKNKEMWNRFCKLHDKEFENLRHRYERHLIFSDAKGEIPTVIFGCYPLHPVSTFILPRLSEKVAQNERTLFTFLSSEGTSTLTAFLHNNCADGFSLITPDLVYDYFEPLFKKESYASDIHTHYLLTRTILDKIHENLLESKIVKTISLIYILEQYERISPTIEEIVGIYSTMYNVDDIKNAIKELIEHEYVIYLKRSNGFLRLKKTSGVNIKQKIQDLMLTQSARVSAKDTLNASNFDSYMYPSRYNDEHEMTRFFSFVFIGGGEITDDIDWDLKSENFESDGIIYAVLPASEDSIQQLARIIEKSSKNLGRYIFVLPKHYREIDSIIREYYAVSILKETVVDDPMLFEEFEVVFEDLHEIIRSFISSYTHPDERKSIFIHDGKCKDIRRKAALTELMSNICDETFSLTPIVNNEAVNRNEITSIASNSRGKIIAALLRNELESGLGLSGSGQEVSIMRSSLIRTGVWDENNGMPCLHLRTGDANMDNMLSTIENFVLDARHGDLISFSKLYNLLIAPEHHIGLRKGLIPIYLAAVIHEYKQHILISDSNGQLPTSADVLLQINANPSKYFLSNVEWDQEKDEYIHTLATAFGDYIVEAEMRNNSYEYVAYAMKRWYMALPKYSKECRTDAKGIGIQKRYLDMIGLLRQGTSGYDLLFKRLPSALHPSEEFNPLVANTIVLAKTYYDELPSMLLDVLVDETKKVFALRSNEDSLARMSLSSVVKDWCDTLESQVFEQIFSNGAEKCLELLKISTNDEVALVARLAKLCTGLRIEDWDGNTQEKYVSVLKEYKKTAEDFHKESVNVDYVKTNNYQITFVDDNGNIISKRFDKIEYSSRGKLLVNRVESALDAMGRSISDQEKRQILMEILKRLL